MNGTFKGDNALPGDTSRETFESEEEGLIERLEEVTERLEEVAEQIKDEDASDEPDN